MSSLVLDLQQEVLKWNFPFLEYKSPSRFQDMESPPESIRDEDSMLSVVLLLSDNQEHSLDCHHSRSTHT